MQNINIQKVTPEQIDKARRIEQNGEIFYLVENSKGNLDENGNVLEYTVRYDKAHKCITCTCPAMNPPADERGYLKYAPRMCWHIPAAVAHAALYRQEQAEQGQIEAYVRQGIDRETATRVVYAQPTQYSEHEIKRDQERCQARPFRLIDESDEERAEAQRRNATRQCADGSYW